jgi:hypothetical protein
MPQQFAVDDDLVALVWRLAKPQPFENLSFSAALRRVLNDGAARTTKDLTSDPLEDLWADAKRGSRAGVKKAPSPSPTEWAATVPELRARKSLNTWKAICDFLKIDTAGDSARRRLKNWVKVKHPTWPPVPDID